MRIDSLLEDKFSVSIECFPPKTEAGMEEFFIYIDEIKDIPLDFISVTYGAGGKNRNNTIELVTKLNKLGYNILPHITTIGHTKKELTDIINIYKDLKIDNLLALSGDTPAGTDIKNEDGEVPFSTDLIKIVKEEYDDTFCIGVAAYSEPRPKCDSMDREIEYLKKKWEAGAHFAPSQLFFDNKYLFELLNNLEKKNIKIPVIPGIMLIKDILGLKKMAEMSYSKIPEALLSKLEQHQNDPEAVIKIGIEHAVSQVEEILDFGVRGLHFYPLNKSRSFLEVHKVIKDKLPK